MSSFLRDVAHSLFRQYGGDLAEIDVVFASRRAIRYFFKELDQISAPRPRCFSIDSWIGQFDESVKVETRFVLISKLFSIYSKYHIDENFEQFYSFGSLLLSDFDMIDRYMVDAESLYSIVADTRDIEATYSDDVREAAIEFWSSFDTKRANLHKQQEFLRIWRSLYDIYVQFGELLGDEKIAYSGQVYRRVAENFDAQSYSRKTVFVGLNALSTSEKRLLSKLTECDLAEFIWDYDPRWLDEKNSECGYFISRNISQFAQADYFQTSIKSSHDVQIEVIESPTDVGQCKILPELLRQIQSEVGEVDERVAVILTDENLLLPLLYSIPDSISELNISLGFPLRATQAYRFVELLVRLQLRVRNRKFYSSDISAILTHTYFTDFEYDSSTQIYQSVDDLPRELDVLWREVGGRFRDMNDYLVASLDFVIERIADQREQTFLRQIVDCLKVVYAMITTSKQDISLALYTKLLREVIAEQSIEFEGVSGRGLQIMGILESRSLDFDRVIMLSLSDDNFPSSRPDSSYIPQLLLQGYGMPTIAEKSAIWSYYFYRLLQHSTKVQLLYCNVADGLTTGEQSRYISQLEYSSPYTVTRRRLSVRSLPFATDNSILIDKTDDMVLKIQSLRYYPTMFSAYLSCPLSFYFASIERIKRKDADSVELTAVDMGNILHLTMQNLYGKFVGKPNANRYISEITDAMIESEVSSIVENQLAARMTTETAAVDILAKTVVRMVRSIVRYDSQCEDLQSILFLEQRISGSIGGVEFAGIIDRVDLLKDGSYRVIDYKSGAVKMDIDSIEQVFDGYEKPNKRNSVVGQILIYSVLARKKWNVDIYPAIYAARSMTRDDEGFSPQIVIAKETITSISDSHYQQIEQSIADVFDGMCDTSRPFLQTLHDSTCLYCAYALICRR